MIQPPVIPKLSKSDVMVSRAWTLGGLAACLMTAWGILVAVEFDATLAQRLLQLLPFLIAALMVGCVVLAAASTVVAALEGKATEASRNLNG